MTNSTTALTKAKATIKKIITVIKIKKLLSTMVEIILYYKF